MIALPLAAQPIAPQAIAAHMRFLADDLLEGRETGTRGYDIAAEYVIAQFAGAGLRPPGSGWLQPMAFRSARVVEQSFSLADSPLTERKDFVLSPSLDHATAAVRAEVVLAGFGIVAPELHHDDYAKIDVRGRVVLMLTGAPASFPSDPRAYYSGTALKMKRAAERGAVAVLFLNSRTDDLRRPFERSAQQSSIPSMRYLEANGKPADLTGLQLSGRISQATAGRLLAGSPIAVEAMLRDAEGGKTQSFPLKTRVALRVRSEFAAAKSANVVGIVRGSDAQLRGQYVVVSAHLDHLGNHPREGSADAIYNGAQDNASGIACLIEIARRIAAHPPRRSVLFVAFTGEEKGEQGSRYFARHPPVPRNAIVADVNMDMPVILYPFADIIALGGEHSTLGATARRAAAAEHLSVSADPLPEEVRFIRSDQFSFVQEGIPAIHLKSGTTSSDPAVDGVAVTRDWLRTKYHSYADDMNQHLDFGAGAKYAAVNLRLVRELANADARPQWTQGDFFARTFARP